MAGTFTFELVSPEKLLVSKPAAMVTVPGIQGEFGVLPSHSPMVVMLTTGVIKIYDENDAVTERIFVAGGFAEVSATRCTVLADEAVPVSELNSVELQAKAKELADKIAATPEADRGAFASQMEVLAAKLQAAA